MSSAALGPPVLLEAAGLPPPSGNVAARTNPTVIVGVQRAQPADVVQVLLRRNSGSPLEIRALREPPRLDDPVQWFRARLPAVEPGSEAEYRLEWRRAGRRMARLPVDDSWLRLFGVDDDRSVATTSPGTLTTDDDEWASKPRFRPGLEFFAALTVNLCPEVLGATPDGYRINFHVQDGRVIGPRIDAVVEQRGGDWMCIRPDGIGVVNVKITYRTREGALILEEAGGVFDLGLDGYARVAEGELRGAPPFYATPKWVTAHPDWTWLNRMQGVGFGRVVLSKLQVQCDIYLAQVHGDSSDG
jgi:uncharacterized protein DUF3237